MTSQERWGAICWLLSAEFFAAQLIAHLAAPGHDLFLYDISLLGISSCGVFEVATSGNSDLVCSPLHHVFNVGIVLQGALIILGVWLTRNLWPTDLFASWGLLLLGLGGIGAMMVGAFPVDDHMLLHIVGAVTAIAGPGVAFLLLARSLWDHAPSLARWTLMVGVIVLLAGLGHALGGQPFGRGTMERLAVWPQTLWYIGLGAAMLTQSVTAGAHFRPRIAARNVVAGSTALRRRPAPSN
ncbi:Protein of unknown function [Devosia lucknowensis]|uniref:DUF998 domain-containing protein n=1 Tax=Devosia lucknowensis TaxID=1096929 RepID=A0A1Y6EX73_9HYPH|nr:DUF998 domain-containing protein [Devosia lucknowensis]SMQ64873.1 Protein of unknown function [Devosia lucknowensis]